MIRQIKLLLALEMGNFWGINVLRHSKDPKQRRKVFVMLPIWVLLGLLVVSYTAGLAFALITMGMSQVVPAYLALLGSLLVLAFGILKAGNMIFSTKGYDMLCALPVKPEAIVISRFGQMYLSDLGLTALVMVPGLAVYAVFQRPGVSFYGMGLLGLLLVPVLPLVISTMLGTLVSAIASRMRKKSLVQTVLSVGIVLAVMLSSLSLEGMDQEPTLEMMTNMAAMVGELIARVYPPVVWLGEAMVQGNVAAFACFAGVSLGAFAVLMAVISRYFHGICRRLNATTARHDFRMQTLKTSSPLKALLQKGWKQYLASSVYVTNTIIGPIFAAVASAALLITGVDSFAGILPVEVDLTCLIPVLIAAVCTMMTTSSVAVSMEGKQLWLIQSLPIPTKTILDAKILLNLSLIAPFYLASQILLTLALKPDALELVWQLLMPAAIILFAVVAGISVDLRFGSVHWQKEETVVKQSVSAMLGGFAGPLAAILCAAVELLIPGMLTKVMLLAAMLLMTMLLYRRNNRTMLQRL